MTEKREPFYRPEDRWNKTPKQKLQRFIRNRFVREGAFLDFIIFLIGLIPCYFIAPSVAPMSGLLWRLFTTLVLDLLLLAILYQPRTIVYEYFVNSKGQVVKRRRR